MEVTSHISNPTEGGVSHNPNQSECISSQPTANGTLPHHDAEEAPPPLSDRSEDYLSDDSLTGSSSTNDISRLLAPHPITAPRKQKDCCVHCLLACLFCETLSMCFAVGECLACGVGGAGCCNAADGCCCCCVEVAGEAACTEDACQAVLDCGILEDCCGSSECMEICLECCSICFPS